MRYYELFEDTVASGKYVAFDLTHESKQKLYNFCSEQNIPNKLQLDEFHVTLIGSGVDFDWDPLEEIDPADALIDKDTYRWEIFGDDKNILVLRIDNDFFHDRYMDALTAGAISDFPTYKQHITCSYDFDENIDISKLPVPDFDLYAQNEWEEEFR